MGLRHSGGGSCWSQVYRLLLACEQAIGGGWHGLDVDLSVGLGEQLNDTGMWCGHYTVPIDLDDSVSYTNAPALSDATTEETADNAVLHAEAQLLAGMGPVDDGCGDRRAVDDAECHQRLRLYLLCRTGAVGLVGPPGGCRTSWQAAASPGPQFIHPENGDLESRL